MTEELTEVELEQFAQGYEAAVADWRVSQPYASYTAQRSDCWKDGYSWWLRGERHHADRGPTRH